MPIYITSLDGSFGLGLALLNLLGWTGMAWSGIGSKSLDLFNGCQYLKGSQLKTACVLGVLLQTAWMALSLRSRAPEAFHL